ncbi:MAG: chemotaxis protein CheA [Phycisphaerales bacterium]|nr:MAG: chemotaxis protein CheA [Phycisphaerales bacterium]
MEETILQYDVDPEMLTNFLDESEESIATLDGLFVELEQRPKDKKIIESIFRVAHSIKGLAAFLSLGFIKNLTHELETVLDGIRKDRLCVGSAVIDGLLAGFDELSGMLARVRAGRRQVEDEDRLRELLAGIRQLSDSRAPPPAAVADQKVKTFPLRGGPKNAEPDEAQDQILEDTAGTARETAGRTMRVSEEKIDVFMQYVGDLIETSESFNLLGERIDDTANNQLAGDFKDINAAFNQLSDKLQKSLLEIRKVPARNLVQKIPRMVRDLAHGLGKNVQVVMTGQDVQIDKSMIEALESPINHLVRNCVDHGIELPATRQKAGKNETGTITIDISEAGDNVTMRIGDDGSGIDPDKTGREAVRRGLVTAEQAETLSDHEVLQFIFRSGFSTAERVTDVSGRGVGMDVVRTNVESLRGTIDLESHLGEGSAVTLRLPSSLTVLVVHGMLAGIGDQQYIIKVEDIHEAIRPNPEEVVTVGGTAECLHVRGGIYPLIRLHELFGIETDLTDPTRSTVILAHTKDKCAGILVDRILGQQRVVVKDLKGPFQELGTIAGTAVLANSRVGLVLNVSGIIEECLGR